VVAVLAVLGNGPTGVGFGLLPVLLFLAYELHGLLAAGVANNRAKLAQRHGLSVTRVPQVMKLLRL